MYDNNNNYSQQSNMSGSSNNGYHEYYYSAGNVNGTYGQTIDATPGKKPKKSKGFGKKIASVVCLGLVFGVAAGAAFSVPAYMTTRDAHLRAFRMLCPDRNRHLSHHRLSSCFLYLAV